MGRTQELPNAKEENMSKLGSRHKIEARQRPEQTHGVPHDFLREGLACSQTYYSASAHAQSDSQATHFLQRHASL